jgi:8-oxo-dGTP diphosphatase
MSMPVNEQGFSAERFNVIPRTLIFIFDENQVLLLKGAVDKKIWAGKYNGIGGHVEAGEDVLESAQRELFEETGITDLSLWLCGQVMVSLNDHQGIALFIFKGLYGGQALKASIEGSLAWIKLADLEELPVVEDLPALLVRAQRHQPGAPVFYGKYHYDDDGRLVMLFR